MTLQPSETTGLESTLEEGLVSTIEAGFETAIEAGLEISKEAGLETTIESDFAILNTVMSTMPSNQTLQKESKLTTIIGMSVYYFAILNIYLNNSVFVPG